MYIDKISYTKQLVGVYWVETTKEKFSDTVESNVVELLALHERTIRVSLQGITPEHNIAPITVHSIVAK